MPHGGYTELSVAGADGVDEDPGSQPPQNKLHLQLSANTPPQTDTTVKQSCGK